MMGKVFGVGLSRTGTTTLAQILADSGYNMLHYPDTPEKLFSLKGQHGANDLPVCAYYKKLDRLFPNSKFIYTVRDKESWFKSISQFMANRTCTDEWQSKIRTMVYGSVDFDEQLWSESYDRYDREIREYFKGNPNFLELNIVGGDSPFKLYNFLNIKPKHKQFPVTNRLK